MHYQILISRLLKEWQPKANADPLRVELTTILFKKIKSG